MTDDEFTPETGSTLRSLRHRLTATERFPVETKTERREYRGLELVIAAEIAYDDLLPDDRRMKRRTVECVAVTDNEQIVAREASTLTVGEEPRWFGLFGGDYRAVPSTSAHALTVIEPVHEAVDEYLAMEGFDPPDLAAALDVELGELSAQETFLPPLEEEVDPPAEDLLAELDEQEALCEDDE